MNRRRETTLLGGINVDGEEFAEIRRMQSETQALIDRLRADLRAVKPPSQAPGLAAAPRGAPPPRTE